MFDFDEIEEKLQQQVAASNAVHSPSLDGEWEDNDGTVVIIKDRRIRGPDGVEVEVTFPRPDAVVFSPSPGATFEGKLTASDRISWDDGASWVRRPLSAKKQTDQNGGSTKAAPNKASTPLQTKTLEQKENVAAKAAVEKPNSKIRDGPPGPGSKPARPEVSSKSAARIPQADGPRPTAAMRVPPEPGQRPRVDQEARTEPNVESSDSAWHYERFEVMKPIVFVRESPGLNTAKVAQVTRGCVVSGRVQDGGWLCLDSDSRASANVSETARGAYMLIDGRNHGLGILLESRGCHGSSKGSFVQPLEFTALTDLHKRAKPSLSSPATGHVVEGSQVQGYPGAESWLELVGGGFLPIASPVAKGAKAKGESKEFLQLESALRPMIPQSFAEAIGARWEPLPTVAATRVEYSLEWQDVQEPERHGRVSFSRKSHACVRPLPPSTRIRLRVVARVFAPLPGGTPCTKGKEDPAASRSWQDHRLVGRWLYGAKPSEYRIGRRSDGLLVFMGPHASGVTVMGVLEPEGHWLQAELASASGDVVGHIRLFYDEEEDAVISNFKNIQNVDWGRDIAAKKGGDEEVLTTVVGRWLQAQTADAITDRDEEEFCYDSFCNKRGKCQRCACQIFVLSDQLMNQEMLCRRCGCPAIHHAKVGKFRFHEHAQKGEKAGDECGAAKPAQKTAMDEIPSRRWSLDDAAPGEEIVEFIIKQLELAKNLYEVLGVGPSSSSLEIRQAYRAISLRVHPDKINAHAQSDDEQSLSALAEDAFKLASSAYEVLNDDNERRSYDRQLYLDWARTEKAKAKPKPKPKPKHAANMPSTVCKKPEAAVQPKHGLWETGGEDDKDPGKRVDEFFKNPTIGTFMNSPYYGEDGVFGSSGTIKENPAGGFSFELPGGGGIHIDNGSGYQRLKQMEEDFAKTGHIPPHLWPQSLIPQGNTFAVNNGPAWAGMQAQAKAKAAADTRPGGFELPGGPPGFAGAAGMPGMPGMPFRPMGTASSGISPIPMFQPPGGGKK